MKDVVVFDFETEMIQARPVYPPKPVGVAIQEHGKKPKYYAWGHPVENNCTLDIGRSALVAACHGKITAQHNSKFDLDVARTHMGMDWPDQSKFHDTMILAYLDNPHERQIDLKNLAHKHLGEAPTERDELKEWILRHVPGSKPSTWGAYISQAPGKLVGTYAMGDVTRTTGLLELLLPKVLKMDMGGAYAREKALLRVLVGMEARGIPVDNARLRSDTEKYIGILTQVDQWIRKYLGVTGPFNIDSKDELANALDRAGKASDWRLTPTGKRSTSKDSIREAINDPMLTLMLDYRSTLANYLRNFMEPWSKVADENDGLIFTQWHSTKQEEKGGSRSGRLSSTPNLQNVPSDERWEEANLRFVPLRKKYKWVIDLPQVRDYIVAPKGQVIIGRDFSQQEPRVLAHFEDGDLCASYKANPRMDIYITAVAIVQNITGVLLHPDPKFARKMMKTIILALMYGLGIGRLAEKLDISVADATKFKRAILQALPGLKMLIKDLNDLGKAGKFMRTWGGRIYYSEPSKIINGRLQEYYYKLLNYLIQGSSADITKEAMIRYDRDCKNGKLIICVHDELLALAPTKTHEAEMKILQKSMDTIELDAPLVSDGYVGHTWGKLKDLK